MSLELPPLRKREGDVSLLVDHFLGRDWKITDEARNALEHYHWPGNVRQLRNAIERAQILANDHNITIDDLPAEVADATDVPHAASPHATSGSVNSSAPSRNNTTGPSNGVVPGGTSSPKLEDLEKSHIIEILRRENGNKARAARILGIHRRKLYRLLERYGISDER